MKIKISVDFLSSHGIRTGRVNMSNRLKEISETDKPSLNASVPTHITTGR